MRTQIITSSDSRLVDKDADTYLIIHPNILTKQIRDGLNKEYTVLENIYASNYAKRAHMTSQIVEKWTQIVGDRMNTNWGYHMTASQYLLVFYNQLFDYVWSFLWKYEMLELITGYENPYFCCNRYSIQIKDFDSNAYAFDEDFHNDMWRRMLEIYGIETVIRDKEIGEERKRLVNKKRRICELPYRLKYRLKYAFEKNVRIPISVEGVLVVNGRFPKKIQKRIGKNIKGNICFLQNGVLEKVQSKLIEKVESDDELRDRIFKDYGESDKAIAYAWKMLPNYFPISELEAFPIIYEYCKAIVDNWHIEKMYHSELPLLGTYFASTMREYGTAICYIQHSGGEYAYSYGQNIEKGANDYYISWGWKNDDNNVVPVAINRVPDMKRRVWNKRGKILYIMPEISTIFFELGYGQLYDNYISKIKEFIDKCPIHIRKRLVVRTVINSVNEELWGWCRTYHPEVRFEDKSEVTPYTSMKESEFVVFDYHSTAIQEAMLLNVPFVIWEGTQTVGYPDEFLNLKTKLIKENVYFENINDLIDVLDNNVQTLKDNVSKKKDVVREYMIYTTGVSRSEDISRKWIEYFEKV